MVKSILVMGLFFSSDAFCKTLLACSLRGADVYSLTVVEENGRLTLKETDTDQNSHSRELSAQDWAAKKIDLFKFPNAFESTLTYDRDAQRWWLTHRAPGDNQFGFQECN